MREHCDFFLFRWAISVCPCFPGSTGWCHVRRGTLCRWDYGSCWSTRTRQNKNWTVHKYSVAAKEILLISITPALQNVTPNFTLKDILQPDSLKVVANWLDTWWWNRTRSDSGVYIQKINGSKQLDSIWWNTQVGWRIFEALPKSLNLNFSVIELSAGFEIFVKEGNALREKTVETLENECISALFGAVTSPTVQVNGYSSLIVALRKRLDLYANVRPV